jgi:hypothetical protein
MGLVITHHRVPGRVLLLSDYPATRARGAPSLEGLMAPRAIDRALPALRERLERPHRDPPNRRMDAEGQQPYSERPVGIVTAGGACGAWESKGER